MRYQSSFPRHHNLCHTTYRLLRRYIQELCLTLSLTSHLPFICGVINRAIYFYGSLASLLNIHRLDCYIYLLFLICFLRSHINTTLYTKDKKKIHSLPLYRRMNIKKKIVPLFCRIEISCRGVNFSSKYRSLGRKFMLART